MGGRRALCQWNKGVFVTAWRSWLARSVMDSPYRGCLDICTSTEAFLNMESAPAGVFSVHA